MQRMLLDFVGRSLQIIMADAIQHFPNEAAGLLFGNIERLSDCAICECFYVVPMGRVEKRSETEIAFSNLTVLNILTAQYMGVGYKTFGHFHTHPISGFPKPSDDDLREFKSSPFKIMAICGIQKEKETEPIGTWLDGSYLRGCLRDYTFSIGAYMKSENDLVQLDVTSPFVHIYNLLREQRLTLEQMSNLKSEKLERFQYAISKVEYWLRRSNYFSKRRHAENKISYWESDIKKNTQLLRR